MLEAEGFAILRRDFYRATAIPASPYRCSFAQSLHIARWRVASESRVNVNAVKCSTIQLRNGPASVRGPLLKGERRI